ncbi:hypothetical protein [Leucobacter sp. USHLN153]|uniref:hypothetical protein n=1 Tax=Leucobacter sp. USHLN153 TaxID=3081268 RepID=UPI003015905D
MHRAVDPRMIARGKQLFINGTNALAAENILGDYIKKLPVLVDASYINVAELAGPIHTAEAINLSRENEDYDDMRRVL